MPANPQNKFPIQHTHMHTRIHTNTRMYIITHTKTQPHTIKMNTYTQAHTKGRNWEIFQGKEKFSIGPKK